MGFRPSSNDSRHLLPSYRSCLLLACFFLFVCLFCFHKFIYLFINFWLCWVFAARGLSLVAANGGYSSLRYVGFSSQRFLLLQSTGSRVCGLQ